MPAICNRNKLVIKIEDFGCNGKGIVRLQRIRHFATVVEGIAFV